MALADLQAGLDAIDAQIAAWTALKPSYAIDGQSVQWNEHYKALLQARKDLRALIILEGGPFEERTVGVT